MRFTPQVHLSPMAGVQLLGCAELLNGFFGSYTPACRMTQQGAYIKGRREETPLTVAPEVVRVRERRPVIQRNRAPVPARHRAAIDAPAAAPALALSVPMRLDGDEPDGEHDDEDERTLADGARVASTAKGLKGMVVVGKKEGE